jgi:hypothetical protein
VEVSQITSQAFAGAAGTAGQGEPFEDDLLLGYSEELVSFDEKPEEAGAAATQDSGSKGTEPAKEEKDPEAVRYGISYFALIALVIFLVVVALAVFTLKRRGS